MSSAAIGKVVLAVDLGGTHLRAALVDETGAICAHLKHETPSAESSDFVVEALVAVRRKLSQGFRGVVAGAAIMVPGRVSKDRKTVVQAPNLSCLNSFELKRVLENRLGLPVLLENDANAAAVGEMWMGAARGARNVICITLGTGVGGGIILDGTLWRGTEGSAGEIGHTTVEPFGGPQCKCGNTGCIEMFASATAVVRMTRESLSEFPKSILHNHELTARTVYDAAKLGDILALEVFKRVGKYLGVGLANLINVLGPEVIVIGGGVANAWDLFEPDMREQISHRAFPSLARNVRIKTAECGDNAGLLGAAKLAFDQKN